jgi:hypothetical protein
VIKWRNVLKLFQPTIIEISLVNGPNIGVRASDLTFRKPALWLTPCVHAGPRHKGDFLAFYPSSPDWERLAVASGAPVDLPIQPTPLASCA